MREMKRRTIQYYVEEDSGLVVSRVGNGFGWPILQYEKIGEGGDFTGPLEYSLEAVSLGSLLGDRTLRLRGTRKVPVGIKNRHREFWGMGRIT